MLRIDRRRLTLTDPEELGVEAGDILEERTPLRHRTTGDTGLGVVVLVGIPAVGRNLRDVVLARSSPCQSCSGESIPQESAR